jgi:hypothetical protein
MCRIHSLPFLIVLSSFVPACGGRIALEVADGSAGGGSMRPTEIGGGGDSGSTGPAGTGGGGAGNSSGAAGIGGGGAGDSSGASGQGAGGIGDVCAGGCLCVRPPYVCPASCYSSPTVFCSNGGPAVDAAIGPDDAAPGGCRGIVNCPASVIGEVIFPSESAASFTRVSADPPCRAFLADGEVNVVVDGTIAPGTTTTCRVHGTLRDGTEVVASVSFQPLTGCCSSLSTAIDSPALFIRVGKTCGTISAADYDQTCEVDADCVAEPEGNFCGSRTCTNCVSAVISAKAQAQYEADLASKIPTPSICPCPSGHPAVCNHGVCAY